MNNDQLQMAIEYAVSIISESGYNNVEYENKPTKETKERFTEHLDALLNMQLNNATPIKNLHGSIADGKIFCGNDVSKSKTYNDVQLDTTVSRGGAA